MALARESTLGQIWYQAVYKGGGRQFDNTRFPEIPGFRCFPPSKTQIRF